MDISLGIFIVPTIVLSVVMFLYFYFKKQVEHKKGYRQTVIIIAATAFMLNLIWEIAQGPLYEGFEYDLNHLSFCALASVADMLMVLILYFAFILIYKDIFWTGYMGIKRISFLILVGGSGAIFAEMWHTARGDWSYAETMPMVPFAEVGLLPVLQFALLPWLVFYVGNKIVQASTLGIKL